MSGLPKKQLEELMMFVQLCKTNSNVLHSPELGFFKQWLER